MLIIDLYNEKHNKHYWFFHYIPNKIVPPVTESPFYEGLVRTPAASTESSPAYPASFSVKPPILKAMQGIRHEEFTEGVLSAEGGFTSFYLGTTNK